MKSPIIIVLIITAALIALSIAWTAPAVGLKNPNVVHDPYASGVR